MTLQTLYVLRDALAQTIRTGFDISRPDSDKVLDAITELREAIRAAETRKA